MNLCVYYSIFIVLKVLFNVNLHRALNSSEKSLKFVTQLNSYCNTAPFNRFYNQFCLKNSSIHIYWINSQQCYWMGSLLIWVNYWTISNSTWTTTSMNITNFALLPLNGRVGVEFQWTPWEWSWDLKE
jgi:hypothetical protein